ncbi:hypothetical protein EDD15DRAFT_2361794 [Pisolithus albus]|nr:hypothetical protein EDD15DRAFT_2361794 [Pisolithus albus]
MPTYSKLRHTSDKENFAGDHAMEMPNGRARRPSEKQRQLEYEQWELAQHRDAKAQKMCERSHHQQLAEEGSEHDTNEDVDEGEQSDIDDEDPGFTSRVVMTKLNETTNERLTFRSTKVPKPLGTKVRSGDFETRGETVTTDDELSEDLCWTSQASQISSDHQSSKHKTSKEKRFDHGTTGVEDTADQDCQSGKHKTKEVRIDRRGPESQETADHATQSKRQRRPAEEDLVPAMVKVQKLTENDGCPRARDYDDTTQEFMATA